MLSDEDWVADGEREWLRKAAGRLKPCDLEGRNGCFSAWLDASQERDAISSFHFALVPHDVWMKLTADHTWVLTKGWQELEQAWLDLLRAVATGGGER